MNIDLVGLSRSYPGGVVAVDDVRLRIASGRTTVVVGPSGSGKSTLLNLIAGLLRPSRGTILFGDRDVTDVPPEDRNIGFVFQSYALFPHRTTEQNVAFGLIESSLPRAQREALVEATMRACGIEHLRGRRPAQLSGGEKQRVALARALARRPALLLLDEPLSAVDAQLRERLRAELKAIVRSIDVTTIHVTHDRAEAMLLADMVVVMNGGRVVQHDTPEQIYRRPVSRFVARFFGEANLIEGHLDSTGSRFDTALGAFAASPPPDCTGPLVAVVRPEMLSVASGRPDGVARVTSAEFLGSSWRVAASVEGQTAPLIVDLPGDHAVAAGETLPLRVSRNSLHLIAAESSEAARKADARPLSVEH